eukprot:TRINITY_DN13115_c0_g1::TRINITY_DN13115_c0_g1_i1::g.10682::m.10682 TRINITY_DN13115_c0_g1::TRINITY_DN13115_c0_g1_i1::g.10682  ORF type:complete len:179 (-),score=21.37,sp/Q9M8T3/Y2910_ARATH/43.16/1e-16,AIG2/PF06094.7/8.9e-16,AIG2_2/PF13772.1/0.015 TRINITY_DN13115_c0_g1_i1:128-625(-)
MADKKHLIFVYGTLKRGYPNYCLLENDGSKFLGTATTVEKFPLVVARDIYAPCLLDIPGEGFNVKGELFAVNDEVLADLDRLEGVAVDFYRRLPIKLKDFVPDSHVSTPPGLSEGAAHVYFGGMKRCEQLCSEPYVESYDDSSLYVRPELRDVGKQYESILNETP